MKAEAETPTARADDTRLPPALVKLMVVITLGALMVQLDATMTNVAYNTLLKEFDVSLLTVQWVGSGYLLAMATVIPLTGWAMDRFGARSVWITCLALFLLGSVLCGVAWSAHSLIAFRIVQGLGGGLLLPLGTAVLAQAAGPRRLGRAMAAVGIPAVLAPILGPVLGGVLVSDLNWRWIFFVNVPICLLAIALSTRSIPAERRPDTRRLDVLGVALLSPACAVIVYGFTAAGRYVSFADWHAYTPLAIGVVLLLVFAFHVLRTKTEPIIDLRLFKAVRTFTAGTAVLFVGTTALFGAVALLPLYYQQLRGYSALEAGLLLVPQGIGMGLALHFAGKLTDKIAPRPITLFGLLLTAVSTYVYTNLGPHTSLWLISIMLVVGGAGLGAVTVPSMAITVRGLPREMIPRATTASRILMQLGGSFGAAVVLIVLQSRLTTHAEAGHGRITPQGMADSFGVTFWWVLAFALAAVIPALLLPGKPPSRTAPSAAQQEKRPATS
ncbi:MDR family MFS transporter [Actinomadura chibensis]|uniref:Multidrug efflux MFS transporter n=1 Tax=Actinomadura chibensis TaxID=392828 RepID=A0A5D0NLP1_9ACTN|nr:MDR family MFS transporter [Actinomadura chibensis]TYB45406.1 multidrug efflux MFS transporter [Actinomadura chibensis]